jgi:uncharacterized membrane protein YeaQ/YmgE (transglycosylase-associated protein family)
MNDIDLVSWLMAGLVAGALVDAIKPQVTPVRRGLTVICGMLGALFGGWVIAVQVGPTTVAFLIAVCAGVLGAALGNVLGWRHLPPRYHT